MALKAGYKGVKNSLISFVESLVGSKVIKSIGDGLSLSEAGELEVNIGDGLSASEAGELEVDIGDGLEIDESNKLSVKIGTGLSFDDNGALEADAVGGGYDLVPGTNIDTGYKFGNDEVYRDLVAVSGTITQGAWSNIGLVAPSNVKTIVDYNLYGSSHPKTPTYLNPSDLSQIASDIRSITVPQGSIFEYLYTKTGE